MQCRHERRYGNVKDGHRKPVPNRSEQGDRQSQPADSGTPEHDQVHADDEDHRRDRELEHVAPRRPLRSQRSQ
jgi:hypothetical protein